MVKIRESVLLRVSITQLLPFIMVFSFYIFSYGANLPGGGFQSGVVFGTIVVITEIGFGKRLFSDSFLQRTELLGVCILVGSVLYGLVTTGYFLGGLYRFTTETFLLSNIYYWVLNFAVYLEVASSIILIVRVFLRKEGKK
jgi:multicomponent Na+:H+ antiporter subunit B